MVSAVHISTGGHHYARVPAVKMARQSADVQIDLRGVEDPEGKGSQAIGKAICPRDRDAPTYTAIEGVWYSQVRRHDGRHFQIKSNILATRAWKEV